MVIKVYVSGISASKEVKKKQQRAILMLDSFNVNYEAIDITEPGREEERDAVQHSFKSRTADKRTPLPPQFFNDDEYCGDYEDFNAAVDVDQLLVFLKMEELKATNGVINGIDGNQDSKGISRNKEEEIEGEKIEDIFVDSKKQVESDSADDGEAIFEKEAENKAKDADDIGEEERSDGDKAVDKETVDIIESIESKENKENDEGEEKQSSEEEDEPIENEETKQSVVENSLKLPDVAESKERKEDDGREEKLLPEIQKNEIDEEESEDDSTEITEKDVAAEKVSEQQSEGSEGRIAEIKDVKQAEIARKAQVEKKQEEEESEEETDEESED